MSEPDRERDGAVAVGAALVVEFLGLKDMAEGAPRAVAIAPVSIGDPVILDMAWNCPGTRLGPTG